MKTILKTICVILACATFFTACANIIEDQIPSNTGNNAGSSNKTDSAPVDPEMDAASSDLIDEDFGEIAVADNDSTSQKKEGE